MERIGRKLRTSAPTQEHPKNRPPPHRPRRAPRGGRGRTHVRDRALKNTVGGSFFLSTSSSQSEHDSVSNRHSLLTLSDIDPFASRSGIAVPHSPIDPNRLSPYSGRSIVPDWVSTDPNLAPVSTPPASPTKEATPLPGSESQQTQEDAEWGEEASTTASATPSTTLPGSPTSSTTSISVSAPAGSFKDTSSEYTEAPTSLELALISDVAAVPCR
ncbi:hypothetical protein EV368DRAFT_87932 [Lentinula lateritia]|nr:hypothetical protein EV368DRAFT_87932 [Lentinula lateritia]